MSSRLNLIERLEWLKANRIIGGFQEPHENQGNGATLPWVIMAKNESRGSAMYDNDDELESAVSMLERFGADVLYTGPHTEVIER